MTSAMTGLRPVARTCLHCALARALRAESPALAAAGLEVQLGRFEPVLLPVTGARLYRRLRRLLAEARAGATAGPVKVTVLDLAGKSHVEVTATLAGRPAARVLSCSFSRYEVARLMAGFAESIEAVVAPAQGAVRLAHASS
jgi:hypothetical protein